MDPETASSSDSVVAGTGSANGNKGKHRNLQQEISFMKEELTEVENSEKVSTMCAKLLAYIETRQDALLPSTIGPINILWDRWFEGDQEAKGCRCSIL